jgi:hypothetical protein
MKVKIEYIDSNALEAEEIVANVKARFGDTSVVSVMPDSTDPFSLMYFAIQDLVTSKQIEAYFHEHQLYEFKCRELIDHVLNVATEAVMKVLRDNERRLE